MYMEIFILKLEIFNQEHYTSSNTLSNYNDKDSREYYRELTA